MSIENPSGDVSAHRPTNLEDLRSEMPSFMKKHAVPQHAFCKSAGGLYKREWRKLGSMGRVLQIGVAKSEGWGQLVS